MKIENKEEEEDFDFDFDAIREVSRNNKGAKECFDKYINASISNVDVYMREFLTYKKYAQELAISTFMNKGIESMSRGQVTRLCVILDDLNILSVETIKELAKQYIFKAYPDKPEKPEILSDASFTISSTETNIELLRDVQDKYKLDVQNYNKSVSETLEHNQKVETLQESLFDVISDGIFGDESYDIDNTGVEYVYFTFLEHEYENIKTFVKSLWKAGGSILTGKQVHSDVKRINIVETTGIFPFLEKKQYEVRIYFDSLNNAQKFLSAKGYFLPIFEQYKMMNHTMNQMEMEQLWDINVNRSVSNGSLSQLIINPILPNIIPINDSENDDLEDENESKYDNYAPSDIIMGYKIDETGEEDFELMFYITPRRYYENEGCLADFHFHVKGLSFNDDWDNICESMFVYKTGELVYIDEAISYLKSIGIYKEITI